jgi:hypothetical protein
MKAKTALLTLILASSPALADVVPGRYVGHSAQGAPCSMDVISIRFEGDIPHPLNERVEVRMENGVSFTLSHLPLIDRSTGRVRPEGGKLTGARGVRGAGDAMILEMIHSETYTGPESFVVLHDDYKDASKSSQLECLQVRKQGE